MAYKAANPYKPDFESLARVRGPTVKPGPGFDGQQGSGGTQESVYKKDYGVVSQMLREEQARREAGESRIKQESPKKRGQKRPF